MRTRRSPRNQEILWRALGGQKSAPAPVVSVPRCWDCANYPKHGRARGTCAVTGTMVNGAAENRDCFKARRMVAA
jgi:NADH:ubiquinone oxidoreductase subunit B-like Fe-S oxidoreductase